jgi:hypothetical protein
MYRMGLRFRRVFQVLPGLRLNVSRSEPSRSSGRRGAWVTLGRKRGQSAVDISGTGPIDTDPSPWARPAPPHGAPVVPGMEVTELTQVEIEVPPALESAVHQAPIAVDVDDDMARADPALMRIAIAIAILVAVAAIGWALLV